MRFNSPVHSCAPAKDQRKLPVWTNRLLAIGSPLAAPTPISINCVIPGGGPNDYGIRTALGCFNAGNPKAGIGQILGWAVILGFGIAFLLAISAGFQVITASGDPKRMQAAKELLTAAISGLLLIIFSVFLLNLIGFSILFLPGFQV